MPSYKTHACLKLKKKNLPVKLYMDVAGNSLCYNYFLFLHFFILLPLK